MNVAVAPNKTWSLPGIEISSDTDLARELSDAIPELELDAMAHRDEHGIEVELPLIHHFAPNANVVGIAIGVGDMQTSKAIAEGLRGVLENVAKMVLLLISSDMNHYANDEENRRLDELAMSALEKLDSQIVFDTIRNEQISMCGVLPAVAILEAFQRGSNPLTTAKRVSYLTSADTTGDTSRVVGYCGMLFQ